MLWDARLSKQKQLDEDPNPRRYEQPNPGDMLHIDIKKFGKFDKPGHRVMKRSDERYKASGKGHEYADVCVDDHSRYSYVEILDEGEAASATPGFLRRAVEHFAKLGVDNKRVRLTTMFKNRKRVNNRRRIHSYSQRPNKSLREDSIDWHAEQRKAQRYPRWASAY